MKKAIAVAFLTGLCLTVPSAAHADYYLSKGSAQRLAKDAVSNYYEDTAYGDVVPYCRPQGRNSANSRYRYHRWTCTFAILGDEYDYCDSPEEEYFGGRFLIVGQSGRGRYSFRVLNGLHCF